LSLDPEIGKPLIVLVLVLERLVRPSCLKLRKTNLAETGTPNNAKTFEDENDDEDEYDMIRPLRVEPPPLS
jgi:hypothetical protein